MRRRASFGPFHVGLPIEIEAPRGCALRVKPPHFCKALPRSAEAPPAYRPSGRGRRRAYGAHRACPGALVPGRRRLHPDSSARAAASAGSPSLAPGRLVGVSASALEPRLSSAGVAVLVDSTFGSPCERGCGRNHARRDHLLRVHQARLSWSRHTPLLKDWSTPCDSGTLPVCQALAMLNRRRAALGSLPGSSVPSPRRPAK